MLDPHAYPLSPQARIDVALRVMKAEMPFRVNALPQAADLKMASILPPSSPVLKKGFELDARDWLRVLSHIKGPISPEDIRTLSRLRDRWAHQQTLDQSDATRFCETAADLMSDIQAADTSRAPIYLASRPSGTSLISQTDTLHAESYRDLSTILDLDADDAGERRALFKYLTWQAALALTHGSPALAVTLINDLDNEDNAVPPVLFNWILGLSSDAPRQMIRSALHYVRTLLEADDEGAY